MTTLITHPLPVLAVGLALGSRVIPPRLLLAGMLAACLPDFDVVAFKLGIAYHDAFGHRGFSHSLLFAAILGALAALACRPLHSGPLKAGLWVVRIPRHPATQSALIWPGIPRPSGHLF
ncbi:metal-dependent hydrolase, partial [Pseudomonas aeruginosa]|nr:metal-dependent hydrolase [Pseudomonas aeruginosa]MCS7847866.1 metal-dependent hydrolase [Pseudomonas aeruginosa]